MDKIHIEGLRLRTIIGFHDWEKEREQDVLVHLTIHHDQRKAAASDDVAATVDYATLRDEIIRHAEKEPHGLLETLAEHIAKLVLQHDNVKAVDVRVDKPHALRYSENVGVEIHRSK